LYFFLNIFLKNELKILKEEFIIFLWHENMRRVHLLLPVVVL